MIGIGLKIAGFILPKMKGWLVPIGIISVVILVSVGIIWSKNTQIEKANEEIAKLYTIISEANTQLRVVTDNRDQLVATINNQNTRIRELQAANNEIAQRANESVEQVIIEAETFREEDAKVGANPQDMNLWLKNIFNL